MDRNLAKQTYLHNKTILVYIKDINMNDFHPNHMYYHGEEC